MDGTKYDAGHAQNTFKIIIFYLYPKKADDLLITGIWLLYFHDQS